MGLFFSLFAVDNPPPPKLLGSKESSNYSIASVGVCSLRLLEQRPLFCTVAVFLPCWGIGFGFHTGRSFCFACHHTCTWQQGLIEKNVTSLPQFPGGSVVHMMFK